MNLTIETQVTAEDYYRAEMLHQRPRLFFRLVFFTGMLVAIGFFTSQTTGYFRLFEAFLFLLLLGILIRTLSPWGMKRRVARRLATYKALQQTARVTFSDEGMCIASDARGEWKTPWSDFFKWRADDETVLVYPAKNLYHILRRRWFPTDACFQDFKELLGRRIGPAGQAKK